MARPPHIVVAGLDFGTSYTKCIVRNLAFPGTSHVVPFSHNGRKEPWVPSVIYRHDDGSCLSSLQTSDRHLRQVPYIKMRLLGLMDERARDWRSSESRSTEDLVAEAEADAAFFLSHVLRDVSVHIRAVWADFGSNPRDQVLVNVCIPVQHAEKPEVEARFRVALVRAYLANDFANPVRDRPRRDEVAGIPIGTPAFREAYERCNTYPETSANLQAFLKSPSRQNGLFIMADVGGGTVDVSIFDYNDQASPATLTYYHNEVICAGSSQHELRLSRLLAESGHEVPLRQLTAWKERRMRPDGLESADLDELMLIVRNELRIEIGGAVGLCIQRTMQAFGSSVITSKGRILSRGKFFFAGGGYLEDPYERGARFFEQQWSNGAADLGQPINPPLPALRIPYPSGLEIPEVLEVAKSERAAVFNRLTVAYGLSFAIESLDEQRFPSSIERTEALPYGRVAEIYGEDTADT